VTSVCRRLLVCLVVGILLGTASHVIAAEYESRIWTDSSGKHEIKAKFIDVVNGTVRLERPNGDIARIPLTKLSQADLDYVKQGPQPLATQPPSTTATPAAPAAAPAPRGLQVGDKVEAEHFSKWQLGTVTEIDYEWDRVKVQIDGERDFAWNVNLKDLRYPGTTQQPILVPPPSPTSSLKTIRPNYDDMERLLADGKPADHVAADPLTKASWQPRAVRLKGSSDISESPVDFAVVAGSSPLALVLHGNHTHDSLPRVELIDMQSRKVLLDGPAPPGTGKMAMSPTGKAVATSRSEVYGPEGTGEVDFWKLVDKKITHWITFAPYVMNSWPNLDPEWFDWLDDERLFTMNREGQLILWNVENAKAIYELEVDGGAKPILSHGRKYLVVPTSVGVQFFDAQNGDLLAVIGSGDYRQAKLVFSPSGKQLAIASSGFIDVLDVSTGECTRSFPCKAINAFLDVAWIDEDYLFSADGSIVNIPLRLVAWKYEMGTQLVKSFGGIHWALLENRMKGSQVLVPLDLPPAEVQDAVRDLKEEDLLVVRPGATIGIDVQILDDPLLAQDVQKALEEALTNAGMKVGENESLKLVARTKHGETDQIQYRHFGDFHGEGETISVTRRIYELELLQDGVPVWKRESVQSAPMHLQMQKDESIADAIARVMKPSGASFRGRLPSYVVKPEYLEPLGTSKLSLNF
jgi:hypothetical protein